MLLAETEEDYVINKDENGLPFDLNLNNIDIDGMLDEIDEDLKHPHIQNKNVKEIPNKPQSIKKIISTYYHSTSNILKTNVYLRSVAEFLNVSEIVNLMKINRQCLKLFEYKCYLCFDCNDTMVINNGLVSNDSFITGYYCNNIFMNRMFKRDSFMNIEEILIYYSNECLHESWKRIVSDEGIAAIYSGCASGRLTILSAVKRWRYPMKRGTVCILKNLKNVPELNGRKVKINKYIAKKERWRVLLIGTPTSADVLQNPSSKYLGVKEENLHSIVANW